MIEWSKYEKIGEFKNDLLTWFAPNRENVVYCIKFTDEFFYIGSTQNLRRRFSQYVPALKHNKYDSLALSDAYLEYGAFEIYVLEETNADNLRHQEAYYINAFAPILNSKAENGNEWKHSKISLIAKKNGTTLEELALKLSVSLSSLKATIGGKGNPTLNTMRRIAKAIGCSVSDILDDEDVSLPTDKPTFSCPKCGTPLEIELKEKN